ncbi:glycosyltransferase family 4 protein [Goekera deserti]|uniref:Glycosyltransferase family 4 protein n=1 Tax=Goekera deserti TaxID=2497753 RepID=A0A7K3WEY4_9ACTN|nr:glycosyltransferase family 4 protein [Goekera deserti]NDI48566.1 glycosyltransferase [Goekera deserti]NEL55055.1 glycosyltransferase family 4 protein [Goekera deserti]
MNFAPETTGIAPYTTGFARHLALGGMQVTAVTGHPHYPEWAVHPGYEDARAPEVDEGVEVVRVQHPVPGNPTGLARIWMEIVFSVRAGLRLLRLRPSAVVVVSPALLSIVPAVVLAFFLRFRVGVIVQDLYGAALAETGLAGGRLARATARLERALLRQVHSVAVIHDVFRASLVAQGIPTNRITVMPNWTHVTMPSTTDREAVRRNLGWGPDEVIALHAGNMGVKQGLEGLIDVARLATERGSAVRVVLLGTGSQAAHLATYAEGVGRVTFMQPLPNGMFEAALAAADCLLLHEKPGVLEMSVPSKLTTYFAAGRPVVAATDARSGAAALVTASKAGKRVASGDPGALLDAVEWLVSEPRRAAVMGGNGRRYAAEHLTEFSAMERHQAWVLDLAGEAIAARISPNEVMDTCHLGDQAPRLDAVTRQVAR